MKKEMIFDFGMFDAEDTRYYLETGHKVVAVDADPTLCESARNRFAKYVADGQLIIEHAAISNEPGPIKLHISGMDRGSSSIFADRVADRWPLGTYEAPSVTYDDLRRKHGTPFFLKIDIEGADRETVLSLTHETAPPYLSFEAHHDLEGLVEHCHDAGYREFKIINQTSFRSVQNQECLSQRLRMKLVRLAGFDEPRKRKIDGRWHNLGHSAGPAPWHSDGRWYDLKEIIRDWNKAQRGGWYDVHARTRLAD